MAIDGRRELRLAAPAGAIAPLHTFPQSNLETAQFLAAWETDIRRAANGAAQRLGLTYDAAQELAQAARVALCLIADRRAGLGEAYIRAVIRNAVRGALRAERRAYGRSSPLEAAVEVGQEPATGDPYDVAYDVREWVEALPPRLLRTYKVLYVNGLTQREAALAMGVSQPRVSQYHSELLSLARREFMSQAA